MNVNRVIGIVLLLSAASAVNAISWAQEVDRPPPGCAAWNANLPPAWAGWGENASAIAAANSSATLAKAAVAVGKKVSVTLAPASSVKLSVETPDAAPPKDAHKGMLSLRVPVDGYYWVASSEGLWIDVVQGGKILESTDHGPGPDCASIAKSVQFPLKAGEAQIQLSDNRGAKVDIMVARQP